MNVFPIRLDSLKPNRNAQQAPPVHVLGQKELLSLALLSKEHFITYIGIILARLY